MTTNRYSHTKDKSFDFSDNNRRNFKSVCSATAKELERYVPVNVYNVQCCQVRGFEFCFCKYIVGYYARTGLFIVKGDL
jgi:hypothetical protein